MNLSRKESTMNIARTHWLLVGVIVGAGSLRIVSAHLLPSLPGTGLEGPLGLFSVFTWLSALFLIGIATVARTAGFGLLSCITVVFLFTFVQYVPIQNRPPIAGSILVFVGFLIAYTACVSCLTGTIGYVLGTVIFRF